MIHPRYFSTGNNAHISCDLCPRRCVIAPLKAGNCGVRQNRDGTPELPFSGFVTALAVDPIEKKPLYHFRPGTDILSAGFAGCNLRCPFCQNWHISQAIHDQSADAPGRRYSPTELIGAALHAGEAGEKPAIAYTYSEPLVHIEFLLDSMAEARKAGVANVLVSNGCVNTEAAAEVLDLCDAANIDLKCFSEETYSETLGGDLRTVIDFIHLALEKGVHIEITTLIVPGLNDSEAELNKCRDFTAELETGGKPVPWHLSAYRPEYKWKAPPTDNAFLIALARRFREKLTYVYTGNSAPPVGEPEFNDSFCPHCGKTLVSRRGYRIKTPGLSLKTDKGKSACFCAYCGREALFRA